MNPEIEHLKKELVRSDHTRAEAARAVEEATKNHGRLYCALMMAEAAELGFVPGVRVTCRGKKAVYLGYRADGYTARLVCRVLRKDGSVGGVSLSAYSLKELQLEEEND